MAAVLQDTPVQSAPVQKQNDKVKKERRRPRAKVSLEELFKDYDGDYKCEEWDTGPAVGQEYDWTKEDGGEGWKEYIAPYRVT